ncbi:MAG TPA: hypothetical protein VMG12_17265 [Polyangiaceae bacterium]|nr:hypothetical protein [Polyangiaceae bacterium]
MTRPRLCRLSFALLVGVSIAVACSVDDARNEAVTCSGLSCGSYDNMPPPEQNVPIGTEAPDASTAPPPAPRAKPECGPGSCLPDDVEACVDHVEPTQPEAPDGGVVADAGTPEPSDAGVGDGGVDGPPVDGNFDQPSRPAPGTPRFGCQLSRTSSNGVERACGAAGLQGLEDPCTSSLDCAPGLGCVGMARAGRCLPYCCGVGDSDTCERGFYCAERPLRDEALGEADGPEIPVCARADNCDLGEQKDCTGPSCLCGPDMACKLVRDNGTTSCVKLAENPGQAGQECPCDRGYHCSQATKPAMCVKMCDLDEKDSDTCGLGVCQLAAAMPPGWGICVAATPEQMTP